uniref:Anillin homology domain-containing protein n=1 Tax=Ditylenchus dipsaci TaxID=166011 RepID=A0A915DER4_9BILA
MLKFKRSPTSQSVDFNVKPAVSTRRCSFVSSQSGYSKANVLLKHVSIPLAWPAEEYFGNKKEWREFTVQLILRTSEGKEIFSQPKEAVNRTYTDVDFQDVFCFGDQPQNSVWKPCSTVNEPMRTPIRTWLLFEAIYSLRTVNTLTASSPFYEGPTSSSTQNDQNNTSLDSAYLENYRNPDKMCALGVARFRLRNASLNGRTHTYNLELVPQGTYPGVTRSQLLLSTAIYVLNCWSNQPPFALLWLKANSTYFFFLKCYNESDGAGGAPSLTLPINQDSSIEVTAFQTALRLRLRDVNSSLTRHFLCIAESQSAYLGWKNSFHLQIIDCVKWGEFASLLKNPHAIKDIPMTTITQPVNSQPQLTVEGEPRGLHKTVSATHWPSQQPTSSSSIYGTSSRTITSHYQKSPVMQRRQRRPIPTPDYFQTAELSTTFPAEQEEEDKKRPVKQASPNTYVISLQIGMENGEKNSARSSSSHAKQDSTSSRKYLSNTFVTFADENDQIKRYTNQPVQKGSAMVLPRARLLSTVTNAGNRRPQPPGAAATVSRAETWHYANSSTQFTRL